MRTRCATGLFALIAALSVVGCQKQATGTPAGKAAPADPWAKPEAKQDPLPRPLFFKIEKDGKTSYALGTFHTGVDAETRLPGSIWKRLDAAPAFAMETDITDRSLAADLANRSDGKTLHDDLGDAYWHKLEAALTPKVAARVNAMKPTIAATMLALRGLPQTPPMDGVLLGHAQNEHKPIAYLEPGSVQVAALVKWMDVRALEEMLDDLSWGEQMQKDMLAAYIAGDDQKILALSASEKTEWKKFGRSDAEYDQMMEDMLYHRNASWIARIEQLHADGGAFIAVGAMHLIGPRSVLDLLAQKGYRVTRVAP
ncbi:MAG: TraB/GumN family protein [Acidobacteriota bacterium]